MHRWIRANNKWQNIQRFRHTLKINPIFVICDAMYTVHHYHYYYCCCFIVVALPCQLGIGCIQCAFGKKLEFRLNNCVEV